MQNAEDGRNEIGARRRRAGKERRGFASMSPEKQREIASKGGRAAHEKGTAHEWTSEEARSAGRKGGQISRGGRGRLADGVPSRRRRPTGARVIGDRSRRVRRSRAVRRERRRRVRMLKRVAMAMVAALAVSVSASAQTSGSPWASSQSVVCAIADGAGSDRPATGGDVEGRNRPATTTPMGDTGLWFVPTGEILPAKRWSVSAYRVNFDHQQGFTDVSNWPVTFGYRHQGSRRDLRRVDVMRRIDRDVRPMFHRPTIRWAGSSTSIRSSAMDGRAIRSATCGLAARST